MVFFLFTGCTKNSSHMSKALTMREKLIQANCCCFDVKIVADYEDYLYTFDLQCEFKQSSDLFFTVVAPESIKGLSGIISSDGGKLTFDKEVLAFPTLADGQISPVSAPWVFINTLKSGYIRACGMDNNGYLLTIDDSYQENALQLDILTDHNFTPIQADILWQGRRILALTISNYHLS